MDKAATPTLETRSERHQKAARARWGPVRHVNLAELDADTARLVRALVQNAQAERADEGSSS